MRHCQSSFFKLLHESSNDGRTPFIEHPVNSLIAAKSERKRNFQARSCNCEWDSSERLSRSSCFRLLHYRKNDRLCSQSTLSITLYQQKESKNDGMLKLIAVSANEILTIRPFPSSCFKSFCIRSNSSFHRATYSYSCSSKK